MVGMLYIEVMKHTKSQRNHLQRMCWNKGHKIITNKKKQNNKMKCRQKNRAAKDYSSSPLSFREVLGKLYIKLLKLNLSVTLKP